MISNAIATNQRSFFKRINIYIVIAILSLNAIGLINLYSATTNIAKHLQGIFSDQLLWITCSWILFMMMTLMNYRYFVKLAYFFYFLNIGALIAVMVVGRSAYGAQRWIHLGFFSYQPSETMKVAMIFVMVKYLAKINPAEGIGFKGLIMPAILLAVPFALTAKQPDLGTALLLIMITGTMVFAMRIKPRVLITLLLMGVVSGVGAWKFALKPYQKNRVMTFLYPNKDPRGAGYNSIQAKIAIGSGQFFGKGFKNGSQSQLEFLPEKQTDFIFCVLSEEHGFLGCVATLGIYAILLLSILQCAFMSKDVYGALLCIGIFSLILWHVFVNIGMVTGLLPIVGVPLPLISYGGTSSLTMMAGLGIVSSVYYRKDMF